MEQCKEEVLESEILGIIAEEIQIKSQKPQLNFGTKLQTSVGLIFRPCADTSQSVVESMKERLREIRRREENHFTSERIPHAFLGEILKGCEKFEMLIAQRPKNCTILTDMYSDQVRFLGGKCEGKREDDYQAVIRAVREECGLDLQDEKMSTLYLGSLPKNFYTGRVESRVSDRMARDVFSRAHIFIVLDVKATLNLQFKQMDVVKWVPFAQLLFIDPRTDIKERFIENPKQLTGLFPSFLQGLAEKGVDQIVFFSLDVGMSRNMWGLHAAMLVYFMSIFVRGVTLRISKQPSLKKYIPLQTNWNSIFQKFAQTFITYNSSIIGNFLIKHYFMQWKDEFHKKYRQVDGLDYSFMMLIGSTALMFGLDCYYKSLHKSTKPSL